MYVIHIQFLYSTGETMCFQQKDQSLYSAQDSNGYHCENQTEHMNIRCRKNAVFTVKPSGNNHKALKV